MQPISISESAKQLVGQFPAETTFAEAVYGMVLREKKQVIRLWLSEGIPFAFQHSPMLYEAIRNWLADRLGIHPKTLTMVGSARIGFSLGVSQYGRPFGPESDLDFAAISDSLFTAIASDFYKWTSDVTNGSALPRNETEAMYWRDNLTRLPHNISKGFIDAHKIPQWQRYETAQKIGQTFFLLKRRLAVSPNAPTIRKHNGASLRVYRDWDTFESQIAFNLSRLLFSLHQMRTKPT